MRNWLRCLLVLCLVSACNDSLLDGECLDGLVACDGKCVNLQWEGDHCGSCGNACSADQVCTLGKCTAGGSGITPTALGDGGLGSNPDGAVADDGFATPCVDPALDDPDHCGKCGRACASGLCSGGQCLEAPVGHIVVIGHNFARYNSARLEMNRIAGNAIFLGSATTPDVLGFEGKASADERNGVNAAIDQVAASRSATWTRTATSSVDEVSSKLDEVDVLLIYPQAFATDAELRQWGTEWQSALNNFLRRGGIVVLFDGSGSHKGTWQILVEAGLLSVSGRTQVTGSVLEVEQLNDQLVYGIASRRYRAELTTVSFDDANLPAIVGHTSGAVVLHGTR